MGLKVTKKCVVSGIAGNYPLVKGGWELLITERSGGGKFVENGFDSPHGFHLKTLPYVISAFSVSLNR